MPITPQLPNALTPEQVAKILQLRKNTVYQLISRGEIIAKKFGKSYRVPLSSLSFLMTGLDEDLYGAEQVDIKNLTRVEQALKVARKHK